CGRVQPSGRSFVHVDTLGLTRWRTLLTLWQRPGIRPAAQNPLGAYRPSRGDVMWNPTERTLRYMERALALRETQVGELARLLNALDTERAQTAVDEKRTLQAFADAVSTDAFDGTRAAEGVSLRAKSAEALRQAVLGTL